MEGPFQSDLALGLATLAVGLSAAASIEEMAQTALESAQHIFRAKRSGVFLLDPGSERPMFSQNIGVSEFFLQRYESAGRQRDPILAHVLQHKAAMDNQSLMPLEEWRSLDVYREVFGLHRIESLLEVPLVAGSEVVGTLNLEAATDGSQRSTMLHVATAMGRMIGTAVAQLEARHRLEQEAHLLKCALDLASDGVILTELQKGRRTLNAAAERIADYIEQGGETLDDFLERVRPRPGLTRTEIPLIDSSQRTLTVCVFQSPDSDAKVTTLSFRNDSNNIMPILERLLTPRELQVATLAGRGIRSAEISDQLNVSIHTVKDHLKQIYRKLEVRSRVELARLVFPQSDLSVLPPPPSNVGGDN